jgi:hypothetical protein
MYDYIERLTTLSVARGVGFAALAIICFSIGFIGEPVNFLRASGMGALLVAAGLFLKALNSSTDRFRSTEVWVMLDKAQRPAPEVAARMVTDARRVVLLRWSYRAAQVAAAFIAASIIGSLLA